MKVVKIEEGCSLMTNSGMNSKVDEILSKAKKWKLLNDLYSMRR